MFRDQLASHSEPNATRPYSTLYVEKPRIPSATPTPIEVPGLADWRAYWPLPHEIIDVPGDHFTILEEFRDCSTGSMHVVGETDLRGFMELALANELDIARHSATFVAELPRVPTAAHERPQAMRERIMKVRE
ncbi:hypothetical protein [Frankia sp. Cas3]|uniref:hypothetical protein n=1 Tax=Frankia sp. Cas3 TaxID=3073926 RepID=UPI002AD48AA8|nr:hypothetical protein [Frankia sp. Cas3]